MFDFLRRLLSPPAPKPDPHLDAFGDFEPYYDNEIYEQIETLEEYEAIKRIRKMSLKQLHDFAEQHEFDWKMGKYKGKLHTLEVITKTVTLLAHNAYKRGERVIVWDDLHEAIMDWRQNNAYDNIASINKKLS